MLNNNSLEIQQRDIQECYTRFHLLLRIGMGNVDFNDLIKAYMSLYSNSVWSGVSTYASSSLHGPLHSVDTTAYEVLGDACAGVIHTCTPWDWCLMNLVSAQQRDIHSWMFCVFKDCLRHAHIRNARTTDISSSGKANRHPQRESRLLFMWSST